MLTKLSQNCRFGIRLLQLPKNSLRSNNQHYHLKLNILLHVENILCFVLFIMFSDSKVKESHPELSNVLFQTKSRVNKVARAAPGRPTGGLARIAGGKVGVLQDISESL